MIKVEKRSLPRRPAPWIEYDRATGSAVDHRVAELIATDGPLAVTEPVIIEALAGARTDARKQDLRRLLLRFELCELDPAPDLDAAAHIYRRCRRAGVTPRGLIDCLIAVVAWRCGAQSAGPRHRSAPRRRGHRTPARPVVGIRGATLALG